MIVQMLIGYARVSTPDQNLAMQMDALKKAGCKKTFEDKVCGAKEIRVGLNSAIEFMREGDTLVVWRLDRLARSLKQLIETVSILTSRKIGLKSLQENIDTTTSGGKIIFHIFGALAEFEREVTRERTQAGLSAARARGRKGGRPVKFDAKKAILAKKLLSDETNSINDVCRALQISRATLYRHIKKA